MALSGFAVSGAVTVAVPPPVATGLGEQPATLAPIQLSTIGSGPTLLVTNIGSSPVFVALGSSSVAVTSQSGVVVPLNSSLPLTVGSNTYVALLGAHAGSQVNLAIGT